jgi:hypothetical protein
MSHALFTAKTFTKTNNLLTVCVNEMSQKIIKAEQQAEIYLSKYMFGSVIHRESNTAFVSTSASTTTMKGLTTKQFKDKIKTPAVVVHLKCMMPLSQELFTFYVLQNV